MANIQIPISSGWNIEPLKSSTVVGAHTSNAPIFEKIIFKSRATIPLTQSPFPLQRWNLQKILKKKQRISASTEVLFW